MLQINVGIAGCLGRMGIELVKNSVLDSRINFSGGYEHSDHQDINKSFSELLGLNSSLKVISNAKKIFCDSDVVIDFTTPISTVQNIELAVNNKTPLVIGTTGLGKEVFESIRKASIDIPILQSYNMSVGVNHLLSLVQQSSTILNKNDYDIEITESHHKHKSDAPSGTAILLGERAAKGRSLDFDKIKIYDRTNSNNKRQIGDIGFSVTRGGEMPGEHTISFIGANDRIDLSHKAFNRLIFVKGALDASIFLAKQKSGIYTMEDIITT